MPRPKPEKPPISNTSKLKSEVERAPHQPGITVHIATGSKVKIIMSGRPRPNAD